jgi:small conductance mechanosensitive channel
MKIDFAVWADYARPVAIVVAALLGYLAVRSAMHLAVRHLLERRGDGEGSNVLAAVEFERRVRTLERLSLRVVLIAIVVIAVLTVLATFDVNIGPAVVGLGVVGLAVGFGAQTLVKDWLAGIFVVLENQYSQGDVVRIAGVEGVVEDFSLRRTVLRDADGTLHSVPNGQIVVASNLTRVWAPLNLRMRLHPDTDTDTAVRLIDRVAADLGSEPTWAPRILGTPTAHRAETPGEAEPAIDIVCQVLAGERLTVIAELRRRIADTLAGEGIAVRAEGT